MCFFRRILSTLRRATARHVWVFLQSKNTIELLYIIAYCDILLLPLGEFCLYLRQARNWQGCGALFKATWARQTPINTHAPATFPTWFKDSSSDQGRSEEPESPLWLSSSPMSFYSKYCHWSLPRGWWTAWDTVQHASRPALPHIVPLIFTTSKTLTSNTKDSRRDRISWRNWWTWEGKEGCFLISQLAELSLCWLEEVESCRQILSHLVQI